MADSEQPSSSLDGHIKDIYGIYPKKDIYENIIEVFLIRNFLLKTGRGKRGIQPKVGQFTTRAEAQPP